MTARANLHLATPADTESRAEKARRMHDHARQAAAEHIAELAHAFAEVARISAEIVEADALPYPVNAVVIARRNAEPARKEAAALAALEQRGRGK